MYTSDDEFDFSGVDCLVVAEALDTVAPDPRDSYFTNLADSRHGDPSLMGPGRSRAYVMQFISRRTRALRHGVKPNRVSSRVQ